MSAKIKYFDSEYTLYVVKTRTITQYRSFVLFICPISNSAPRHAAMLTSWSIGYILCQMFEYF